MRRIFEEYDTGRSVLDIITDLNAEGFRTITGKPFNKSSLSRILKNKKYIGIYEFKDIYAEGVIPAIVDTEMFKRVGERLKLKAHAPRTRSLEDRYLLTSKLFCGHCGQPMTGESARGEHGQVYYYYTCNGRKHGTCKKERVKKAAIEDYVVRNLIEILHDDVFIETVADLCMKQIESEQDSPMLNIIEGKQKENQKQIDNVMAAIKAGIITESTKQALEELEEERIQLQTAHAKELLKTPDIDRDQIIFILEKIRDGDPDDYEYRVRIVDTFLNSVYLYDDGKVVLHLNFAGENSTVSLEYTEEAISKSKALKSSINVASALPREMKTNLSKLAIYISQHGVVSVVRNYNVIRT